MANTSCINHFPRITFCIKRFTCNHILQQLLPSSSCIFILESGSCVCCHSQFVLVSGNLDLKLFFLQMML
jgi:hypothetical protein